MTRARITKKEAAAQAEKTLAEIRRQHALVEHARAQEVNVRRYRRQQEAVLRDLLLQARWVDK
jgi:hypothetical protein